MNPTNRQLLNRIDKKRRRKGFDPDGSGYDYDAARKAGLKPDSTGHWPSRVPETGLILKGTGHPTFHKTVRGEAEAGMEFVRHKGRVYSVPKKKKSLK